MSKRVLIVDDDPAQRRILEEVIKRAEAWLEGHCEDPGDDE